MATTRTRTDHSRRTQRTPQRVGGAGSIRLTLSRPRGDTLLVRVAGEIDQLTAELLEGVALTELDPPPEVLALDLEEVGFVGASGVAALTDIQDAVQHSGRQCVTFPSPAVMRALEFAGVARRFDLFPAAG